MYKRYTRAQGAREEMEMHDSMPLDAVPNRKTDDICRPAGKYTVQSATMAPWPKKMQRCMFITPKSNIGAYVLLCADFLEL